MEEGLQILKAMFQPRKAYLQGQYLRIDGALNKPAPGQKPQPADHHRRPAARK